MCDANSETSDLERPWPLSHSSFSPVIPLEQTAACDEPTPPTCDAPTPWRCPSPGSRCAVRARGVLGAVPGA
eukprot:1244717-Lingulodinium_polyedra.AAC.1